MHAESLLHGSIEKVLPWMHVKRRESLEAIVFSAVRGMRLTVTGLGRGIKSEAREKHCIKRADRLLSNTKLQSERFEAYKSLSRKVVGSTKRVIILVDWSDLNEREKFSVLRASTPIKGRSFTLYEEVHGEHGKNQRDIHRNFLRRLKELLPEDCQAVIITDAGFQSSWFREVEKLRWDWVGRIRKPRLIRLENTGKWESCKFLFECATYRAKDLGRALVTRRNPIRCRLIIFKAKPKGRVKKNVAGVRTKTTPDKHYAKRGREPWLLATSLDKADSSAKQIVKLYATRMQIEEAFRDLKSARHGLSLRFSGTYKRERLQVLLLIATIATYVLWLLGKATEITGQHRQYQANTVTKKTVLSSVFLGAQVVDDFRVNIKKRHIALAAKLLSDTVAQHAYQI